MTNNAAKRRILFTVTAVLIAVALLLSCVLTAFFYTRTGSAGTGTVAEGDGAEEVYGLSNRGYGTSIYNGATPAIPSGATGYAINSESALTNFLTTANANPGTTYYGYLTTGISLSASIKPSTDRKLPANATLDGNGYTITSYHQESSAWDFEDSWNAIGSENDYITWWGFSTSGGTGTAVPVYNGVNAYGLSNIISVNYGTIKNLNIGYAKTDSGNSAIQAIYISPNWDGNVSMGGVAGINFGTIYNCTVDYNIKYGFIGSQYFSNGTNSSDRGVISYQQLVAVGGIAGYNGVNPSNTSQQGKIYACKVITRDAFGSFRSQISTYDSGRATRYQIPNDPVVSSVVAGIAAINNGGEIVGVDYSATGGSFYNNVWHSSKSYTGMITGITNLQSTVQGMTLNGSTWNFSPSVVTNVTLSVANLSFVAEAHNASFSRDRYGRLSGDSYTATGNYCGLVGGQVSNGADITPVTVYGGNLGSVSNVNFRQWALNELNSTVSVTDVNMPKFGYGTNNSNDYINEITSISTRFEGQRLENNSTDLTSVGATVSYVWDAEQQEDGSWVSGLRQNIDFTNVSGISGAEYFIYGTQSYVNSNASYSNGSATYVASSVTYGGLAKIPSATSSTIEYNYSILFRNFSNTQAFDAFASVNSGSNFAYAFANALVLTTAHTLDNSSASARELRSWKTIDGGLNQITVTGLNNTAVSVDGINALSDFIAVNRGTIVNLSIAYSAARGTISASGNTAYGFVAGVNYGTIAPAVISTSAVELSGTNETSLLYLGGAVGYNCGSMSGITQNVAGNLTVSGSSKQAFLGGIIGVNNGAGTLQTAVLNGNYDATVQATANSTYGNYVGGFIGAGVNSGSVSTQGNVLTLTQTQTNPFSDWLYSSKMRVQTNANSYTGLFAGLITASPTYSATNPYINGLVAAAPDLDEAVGWFSPTKGVMTLAGYATGTTGASGKYVSTDLIRGQIYTVQDASDAFVSKILTDVYWAPTTNIYRFTVTSLAYNTKWALMPYDAGYRNFVNYGSPLNSGETYTAAWTYENNNNDSYAYTFDAGLYVQNNDASSNPDYLAPVVGVKLIYRMNLQSGVSAGDTTNADDALTLFLSGESAGFEHMNPNNGYKALCAGASGGYGDNSGDPWTVSGGRNIVFNKPYGLDGRDNGGMKISVTGDATTYAQVWDEQSQSYATAEFIAVNNSSIYALKVTVDGNKTYSTGDNLVYSHLVGVNNGTISACTVTVNSNVSLSATGAAVYGSLVGINNGTISTSSATLNGSVSVSGGGISYAGGAVGINRGAADGTVVNFDGGAITLTNSNGTLAVLGGVIGLQDSASLSGVQSAGYGATLTVEGLGAVGGVIGAANAGSNGTTVVTNMLSAAQTKLSDISNAVYGMKLNAPGGYKGLISGSLGDSAVRSGALSGIAAFYPDEVANYAVPWMTGAMNTLSMYGFGSATTALEGLLFKVSDYSNDGGAEYLTKRTISVNGAFKSFTFDKSQIKGLSSIELISTYYYYNGDVLATDASYTGSSSLSGNIYTTSVNGTYAGSATYVPTLDVLIEYRVDIANGENQQLIDFMRGESTAGHDSYAGAIRADVASNASFTLDGSTASQRGVSSSKGKSLVGPGNTINISGTLPTATYDGATVTGGFFAVNNVNISGINVATSENLRPSGYAFGLLAGVNNGDLTNVGASFTQSLNASVSALGGLVGINNGIINGATVSMNGVVASYGDKISFGSVAGVNTAMISSATATLAGDYALTSAVVYSGGAVGENSAAMNGVKAVFANTSITANPTSTAYAGGVVGKQNGGYLNNVGTEGGSLNTTVASGSGYVGGIVGIINTGAGEQTVAGEQLGASSMSGVYAGAYTSSVSGNGAYNGLIAGAVGTIASGNVQGATAHYYEDGTAGDFTIPWFTTEEGAVSMYGYNAAGADTTYATGLLFKMSDYSDDGAADFVTGRTLSSTATGASIYFPISDFSGANSLSIAVNYVSWSGGVKSVTTATTLTPTSYVTYSESRVNNGGDYVPTIDFFATYSVNISSGTEGDINNNADGIANSQLYCFIDGVGNNQLYAGAKEGYITQNMLIYKPANGYVTMSADKVLHGGGNTLMMGYSTSGYVLQLNDRGKDNAGTGTGGYEQAEVNNDLVGATGGLIAVNRGTISDLRIEIRQVSYYLPSYSISLAESAAFGMLVGVNYGTVSGVYMNNETTGLAVYVSGASDVQTIYGGIVGVNAESGVVGNLTVNKVSSVNIDGMYNALYGGVIGQNYGEAYGISLTNSSSNTTGEVERAVYGGAVGSNNGTLSNVTVTVGTAIAQNNYMSRLGATPGQRTINLYAKDLAIWGGALGYNAGTATDIKIIANVNYGMYAGDGNVAAGGVVGMNDGGALSGIKATGWGGFYAISANIANTDAKSVFVGGLVGLMNADGASQIGFISFANNSTNSTKKATLTDSVFALSGGMVTMTNYSQAKTRYGYVTGALAANYANIPEGAVTNTFWFIPDKLQGVEDDNAEVLPTFHGGNNIYPTYISVFGMAPSDWLSNNMTDNAAAFAVNSYGFTFVDADGNPINYLTMDATITSGVLTLTVHKPSGVMYVTTPNFSLDVAGSGGTGIANVGSDGGQDQTLTVSNAGNTGIGYVAFRFESSVYVVTDSAYSQFTQYMLFSFLSAKPFGTLTGSGSNGYYTYSTIDGSVSRSVGDSVYRVYQVWSGAREMLIQGSNKTITVSAVPTQPLILSEGKTFNGGQSNGNTISVTSSFENNIAEYTFGGDLEGVKQTYLVVSEFIAINYGTFTNARVSIAGNAGGGNIYRYASEVISNASNAGMDVDLNNLTGFIYGMLVGVNEGEVSQLGGFSFDRTIELNSDAGSRYNSIFGGMVGAQSGQNAVIDEIGDVTFGTSDRAGGITMSGAANLVAAGGVIGIAIEGSISNINVKLTSESFISVTAKHNTAAIGGVVGDLRGQLSDIVFESEYRSEMMISGTNANGVAALANLVGVINSFSETSVASIERVKVIGVGYLYNGIDENGTVTTSSINLYTAGVVALGANYGNVDTDSVAAMPDGEEKTKAEQVVKAYGAILPAKLDSVYVDFQGYVRAKANTNVGLIAARILNGVTATVDASGNVSDTVVNVNTDYIKNLVWQVDYEGDSNWTTSTNYADYTETFGSNTAVAILGYAPVTIDSTSPDLRGVGMRLWLTNNLYTSRLNTADMVISWTSSGNLNAVVTSNMAWQSLVVSSVYYDESGADLASRFVNITTHGEYTSMKQMTLPVNVASALATMKSSAAVFPNGIYMLRITFNEVYIYNAQQLMTFMSAGADTVKGLASTDGSYSSYANANIGILANDLSVDYAAQGTGNKAEHYYTTAVTMRSDKILEGNGMTVTITTSGEIHSAVIDNKGNTPAGALLENEYYWDYIGGMNTLSSADLNQMDTQYSIGIRAGGLFLGRNLGTIQNVNFSLPNSVTIDNIDYAKWHDVKDQDSWREYGTSLYVGIVTAVNAGTIDNCTLTLGENVKVNGFRKSASGPQLQKGYINELTYKVNTMSVNGGFAGLMYGTASSPSYISNCTVNLSDGSEIRATSQASSFSWSGRSDSVYAYAGGVVGWLTSDSTVYNVTVNGTGTMTAWGDLNIGSFSSGNKVTSAGSIVGLNSDHPTYTISNNPDEFGLIDGVICNWNGAAYFLSTGNNNIFYSGTSRVNYYIGAQLAGVAEENSLNNIYFMYGIDQYKTFHQDNWYYGDNVAARQASADFLDKYNYIVSRAVQLLENDTFGYSAVYAIAQKSGSNPGITEIAYRNADGSVTVNLEDKVIQGTTVPAFTFENYANYQDAVDGSAVSGATNFSLYVAEGTTFYVANQYFPRITATLDSGGDKNLDFVGARASAMMTSDGSADWNNLFKPNNVYIYEVGFGSNDGTELDMNDPDTTAYLSFQTKDITSDVAVNISLATDSLGAQFVWSITETWMYPGGQPMLSSMNYYDNVTSLEQAKQNNTFNRVFDRENEGADYVFTYYLGLAVKIAMDDSRYYYNEEEGVFYDSVAKIYDGTTIDDPMLYYADEEGNPINMPDIGLGEVSASIMSPSYYKDNENGVAVSVSKSNTDNVGAYRIRISFSSEGGENSKVNTTNRTIMFSDFDHIDIYTVVLPKGVQQTGVSVSKTYDGTDDYKESTTVFNGMLSGDTVALDTGEYTVYNAGSGNIFKANFTEFTFSYGVMNGGVLEIKTATIPLFEGSGDTGNYAPATSVKTGTLTLVDDATAFYVLPKVNYTGTIYRKHIALSDIDLDMYGETFVEGGVTPPIEYDARTTYDTAAFQSGSTILKKGLTLSADKAELLMQGYRSGESVGFTITFRASGGNTDVTSVKNYGTYEVYLNIIDKDNFTLYENNNETGRMYLGQLSITPYAIQTADVTYVIDAGFLSKIFDNTGEIPFKFNADNLRIVAKNGYEVQPDEYTLTVGAMYTTNKNSSVSVEAKNAGEYDIYFRISNFNCPLGNYTLENMTVSFVDSDGKKISYFVLPKEITLTAATKEFDNTKEADASVTTFTYEDGEGPVDGTKDVFGLEYAKVDAGANIDVTFTGTSYLTLNGMRYTVINVVSGSNKGTDNYCVSSTTVAKGNITPVKVTLISAKMIYNNRDYIDYRAEGTEVVIQDAKGNVVNIYPAATFNNKNAGENKTVTFKTTTKTIAGTIYNVLQNSTYVSPAPDTTGVGFAGNYYVEKTAWSGVGEIIKNTISVDDLKGNITIVHIQEGGTTVVSGSEYAFENLSGESYTYRYGYIVGFKINANAVILEDDKLEDHLTVSVTNTTNEVNGYAGTYTLELVITSKDFDWDEDVTDSAIRVTNFTVGKQTLTSANINASLATNVYTYKTSGTTLTPTFSVTDNNGRTITAADGLSCTLSSFTNSNTYFSMNTYRNGSRLDVGDYHFTVSPRFSAADNLNYTYSVSGKQLVFYVIPYRLTQIIATKEFDNTTSFTTAGNEAEFNGITGGEPFTPAGSFSSKNAVSQQLRLDYVETWINGTKYNLLKDADGSVTNNTWGTATGTIKRYTISASELNSYLSGWVADMTERQTLSIKNGAQFEYRSDEASGYTSEHFLFDASGMSYNFAATSRNAVSLTITQNGSTVETVSFTVTLKSDVATYMFGSGDQTSVVLPAGAYSVSVMINSANFTLDSGAGSGSFTIGKQEISGGGASGSANVFIVLDNEFSYIYGESGFNLPTVGDAKFAYTMNIIDKYTGKIAATYTEEDAVIDAIKFTTAADSTDFLTSLTGPLYIGGYYVWASGFAADVLDNYAIPEDAKIAVYVAGTIVPEAPDPEEGEEGGESGEEGSTGDTVVVIPSVAAAPAYFILPRTLNITSVEKTYDGTDSFAGATLTSDAVDGLTADMLSGVYASPNANYDSTGTVYIEGNKGSDYLKITVVPVTVNGKTYYVLSADGVAGNYCLNGELDGTVMTVSGAKIKRVAVEGTAISLTSDTFETVYGSGESPVLPEVIAHFGTATEATEKVSYTADNVVYKQGGEAVTPANVGGYEMYLTGIAFDNYEVTGGLTEGVLVNAGRGIDGEEEGGTTGGDTTGGDTTGGETGGETGEEGGETEEPAEVYTYYIVPQEIIISSVVKFYDKGVELAYYGEDEDEDGISADVTVTDAKGNDIVDDEDNPIVLRVQGRFAAAGAGVEKDVYVDFTPFGYYVNFDTAAVNMYYRLLVVGEDGTANVASNYCIAASETAILPAQFGKNYVPDPELGYDDTPVVNNGLVYNMTLVRVGTEIPAPLTVENVSKVYDGTFEITKGAISGLLEGDEGLTVAKWRYDDKNAATGKKSVYVEVGTTPYVYGDVTYYAIYIVADEGKVLSDYGVAATGIAPVEETTVGEEGEETTVTVNYAIVESAGAITPLTLTSENFVSANVAGIQSNSSVEYNSSRTYTASDVRATLSALVYTEAADNDGGTLTVSFHNGDVLTFTATLGGDNTAHNAGVYTVSIALSGDTVNYKMTSPYTFNFTITRQSITAVYVTTGNIAKTYDGTGDMPEYSADGWQVYAVDKQGAAIEMSAFGSIDMSAATIVFTRYNEEEGVYEYFTPVNVTEEPGYRIYVKGFSLDSTNYTFSSADDATGCVSFDQDTSTAQRAYYRINPFVITLADGAFDSKKFDGSFSLRKEGVQGETVIIGDKGGVNASLAGTYGDLEITPYIGGVSVSDEALNQESVAQNYVLYYGGVPVTDATVLAVTDYTVTQADVLVAERENGRYVVGISGLQGLDFLFVKTADITAEARERITARLLTGETWTGGSFDSSSDFAKLNQAVFSVLSLYVNNGESAVVPSTADAYVVNDFTYAKQGGSYVLTFTFAGMNGYDESTATDRYTFVINGASDDVKSTNYSTTSSELESGQLTGATAGNGVAVSTAGNRVAVSTAGEFKEAIKNNRTFYLTGSIYGVDMSDVSGMTFTGAFDGRGYTVSLTGSGAKTATSVAAGLLVAVNGGTIKNVNFKLMPTGEMSATTVGGLVGVNNGAIENVSVELVSELKTTGAAKVGGVVGENAAGATVSEVSFVYSANVSASGAAYGAIAGNNAGTLEKVAVRVSESAGAGNYTVSAASAGYVAGSNTGTADGVIVAVPADRVTGASALFASGTTTATNVYSYLSVDGAAGGQLSLLEPYTNGYIGYYFATAEDYTTDGAAHNELTAAGEYNKSYYVDYTQGGEGYIAIEAIAPYNRFIWDGYGISYRTAFGDGNVGSSLNRIVALFAAGDIATQFTGTTITTGVNAFTVAIGVRGGTVEVEEGVETSIKEVVYTGYAQVYKVNITVTSGGVSETKELSVGGTDAGYYSKASLEGIIGGAGEGETIGDVTYDSGSRTEYTFSGGGTTVANGIALVIYPRQTEASEVTATKYYDTTTAGTLTVKDGETVAGTLGGNYYDAAGATTSQVAAAKKFGFASFGALTRSVLSKDGVLYGIVEKVTGEGDNVVVTYETQAITIGSGENATNFTTSATVSSLKATYGVRELMIAISRLADEDYATSVLTAEQLTGFEFVRVYNLTASVTAGEGNAATVGASISLRPVLTGENGGNYSLYSAEWLAPAGMTIGASETAFTLPENDMTVAGAILPVDLGIFADYTVGADQSYNAAMLDPEAVADRTVSVTREQAAEMGISSENYDRLVQEVQAGLSVTFAANFYDGLVTDGVLEERADGKYYVTSAYAKYSSAELPSKADGGNFVITMADNTVTFRYFGITLKDDAAFYTLTGADDYAMWIENEAGTADYYAIDMLLVADIDFGGKLTDMLAWRDADGNVVGYKGTFDGDGKALTNMLIIREGSAALFERVDEGAVVRNLTVADTVTVATGAGSAAGGIAVDNYGAIVSSAFEGVLSAEAKTGGIAATNYGTVTGGASVNRAYVSKGGAAEGIAENADDGSGTVGTATGVSITESAVIADGAVTENTTVETADGGAANWNDTALVPVITAYVFDETYVKVVKVDGNGKFVTDNFFKLNAVDKLFGWVGAAAVTSATQTGFYGTLTLS